MDCRQFWRSVGVEFKRENWFNGIQYSRKSSSELARRHASGNLGVCLACRDFRSSLSLCLFTGSSHQFSSSCMASMNCHSSFSVMEDIYAMKTAKLCWSLYRGKRKGSLSSSCGLLRKFDQNTGMLGPNL